MSNLCRKRAARPDNGLSKNIFRATRGIRTPDPLITNQLLWPTELQWHRQTALKAAKNGMQMYNTFAFARTFFQYFFYTSHHFVNHCVINNFQVKKKDFFTKTCSFVGKIWKDFQKISALLIRKKGCWGEGIFN